MKYLNDYNNTIEYAKKEGVAIGERRGERRGALKVLELVKQGYKPTQIKKMVLTNK